MRYTVFATYCTDNEPQEPRRFFRLAAAEAYAIALVDDAGYPRAYIYKGQELIDVVSFKR